MGLDMPLYRTFSGCVVLVAALGLSVLPTVADTTGDTPPPPVNQDNETRVGGDAPPPPPPENTGGDAPPPPPSIAYYVMVDGQRQGPLDQAALVALIRAGKLKTGSQVWTSGMANWDNAGNVAELAELINANAAPPPPPEKTVFVLENGKQAGPYTLDQIKKKIAAGTFTDASQVWQPGMAAWARAADVPELASLLRDAPRPEPKDAVAFMAGRWELGPMEIPVEGAGPGVFRMILEFAPNGTYRSTVLIDYKQFEVEARNQTKGKGTYTAKFTAADKVTIVAKGAAITTVFNRQTGASQQNRPETIDLTFTFTVIDQNSLDDGSAQKWRRVSG